jgi:hypothetical protein
MHRQYSLNISAQLLRTQGYVNGQWINAPSTFPVLDPATSEEIANVADCGPAEAKLAVDAAYKAFYSWKHHTAKVGLYFNYAERQLTSRSTSLTVHDPQTRQFTIHNAVNSILMLFSFISTTAFPTFPSCMKSTV